MSDIKDITTTTGGDESLLVAQAENGDAEKIVTFEHTSYKWELNYRDIPDGDIHKDMNLKVTTNPFYKKEMASLLTDNANPQYLDFAFEGEMPAPMNFYYRTDRKSVV